MHFQQEIKKQCDPCQGHRHPPQCKHPLPGKPRPHRPAGPDGAAVAEALGVHKSGFPTASYQHCGCCRREIRAHRGRPGSPESLQASRPSQQPATPAPCSAWACSLSTRLLSAITACCSAGLVALPRQAATSPSPLQHEKQLRGLMENKQLMSKTAALTNRIGVCTSEQTPPFLASAVICCAG